MSEPFADGPLSDLESALQALRPAGQVRRDQLLFRAGQASVPRGWFWPASTAVLSAAVAALGLTLAWRPAAEPSERVVFITVKEQVPALPLDKKPAPVPIETAPAREVSAVVAYHRPTEYGQLKQQALRWGVDSLPMPATFQVETGAPQTLHRLMNALNKSNFGYDPLP